ncbi:hypothetical protein, partial [Klebsiella pneumoniae]|uniref:hypothetical protein n=1 Tax=Klebsiella pneumoniae TaxID=573 RepID=UPI001C698C95
ELVWGVMLLLKVFCYTSLSFIDGGFVGNMIVRVLISRSIGFLFINPLAMLFSFSGIMLLIMKYDQ